MSQPPDQRFVFDTNALVSGLLMPNSIPAQALTWAGEHGVILTSLDLLNELRAVLSRPKFDRYLTRDERDVFLASLIRDSVLVDIVERVAACRDPKDDHVLELAVNGQATCIVSGDNDLLILHPFRGMPILKPADFLLQYGP